MKHDIESILAALSEMHFGPLGKITLTKTMLEKHIIDANKTIVQLALHIGIDYATIKQGEKITIKGRHKSDNAACSVSFYRTKARGDKRFSISGLKTHAAIGDTVAITHDVNGALVINATRETGAENA
jgi:hypothetical protein